MLSESVLCALVLLKAVRGWRRQENLLDSGKALVAVLIRDSILYFLMYVSRLHNTVDITR